MAVTKKKFSVCVDADLYEAAKLKYGKISPRINELLAMDLYGSSEKDKLVQELHDLKIKERSITQQLCEIEKQEAKVEKANQDKEAVLNWISDVYPRVGYIGLNLLKAECERHNVDYNEMVAYLEAEEIATMQYAM